MRSYPNLLSRLRSAALPAVTLAACLPCARSAEAGIASTTGAITVVTRPQGTLASNTLESDTTIYTWFERSIRNPGSQSLNHVGAGTVSNGGAFGANRAIAGTRTPTFAESFIIHFDQAGAGNATISNATITFDRPIIGVWLTNGGLTGSDGQWAPSGLTYSGLTARPYELGTDSTSDRFSISSNLLTLTILNTYTTGSGVDQLRVLVNPEPSSLALSALGIGLLGSLVLRRRRRRSRVG